METSFNSISNSHLIWNILQPQLPGPGIWNTCKAVAASALIGIFNTNGIPFHKIVTPLKIAAGIVFPPMLISGLHAIMKHTLDAPWALHNLRWFRFRVNTGKALATSQQRAAAKRLQDLHAAFRGGVGKDIVKSCAAVHWEKFSVDQIRTWAGGDLNTFRPAFQQVAGRTISDAQLTNLRLALQQVKNASAFNAYVTLRDELESELKTLGVDTKTLNGSEHVDADAAATRMHRITTRRTLWGIVSATTMASLVVLSAVKSRVAGIYADTETYSQGIFGTTAFAAAEQCAADVAGSFFKNGSVVANGIGTVYRTFGAAIPLWCSGQFALSFFSSKPANQSWLQHMALAPGYLAAAAYFNLTPEFVTTSLGALAQSTGLFSTMTPEQAGVWVLASPLILMAAGRALWTSWKMKTESGAPAPTLVRLAAVPLAAINVLFQNGQIIGLAGAWSHALQQMTSGWQFAGEWGKSNLKCALMNQLPQPPIFGPSPNLE